MTGYINRARGTRYARPFSNTVPRRSFLFACSVCALAALPLRCEAPNSPGSAVAVFPGAEGYGTTTPGGRGGQVIRVTNLNDAGPGSLREALLSTGPRTVVFDVSGYIRLDSDIEMGDPFLNPNPWDFVTVAGQTAPSPGITVIGAILVRANDVLIQHLRLRPGIVGTSARRDALMIEGPVSRVVIDHVSVSWAGNVGKNMAILGGSASVTISNCINSEAFPYGLLIVGDSKNIAVSGTLFAHNFDRNPEVASNTSVTFTNNLIYNPGGVENGIPRFFFAVWRGQADGTPPDGPALASVIGNVAKRGPTSGDLRLEFHGNGLPGSRAYTADNIFPEGILYASGTGFLSVSTPAFPLPSPLTILESSAVEAHVLATAGARPADRDAVDTRIINDVINGTGNSLLNDESEVGGFPALAENTRVLTIPTNHADIRPSGYSVLEEDILFPLARAVERP